MASQYTIGELSRAAEIPTTTVRYYERIGLVKPESRSYGNYRLYGDDSLHKLKFIRAAQAIGFKLDDVKSLLGSHDGKAPSCSEVQDLMGERLTEIEQKMKDMRHVRKVLKAALAECLETQKSGVCYVIETLRAKS